MASDKEKTQRRVYVLPTELVERIVAFQEAMGISSEVEAARRLLDEALKRRDSGVDLVRRFQEKLKETRMISDVARDVLVGHPLVTGIEFQKNSITFRLSTGEIAIVESSGAASLRPGEDEFARAMNLNPDGEEELPF